MSKKTRQPETMDTAGLKNEPRELKRKLKVQGVFVGVLSVLLLFQMVQLYQFQNRIAFIDQLGAEKGVDLGAGETEEGEEEDVSLNTLLFDFVNNLGTYEENKVRYEGNLSAIQEYLKASSWLDDGLTLVNPEGAYEESALTYTFKDATFGVTLATLSLGYDGLLSVDTYNAELVLQDRASAEMTLKDLESFFQADLLLLRETVQQVSNARAELAEFLVTESMTQMLTLKGMSVGGETETENHYSVLVLNSEQVSLAEFRVSKTSGGIVLETLDPSEILELIPSDALALTEALTRLEALDARTVVQKKVDATKAELAGIMGDPAFIDTLSTVGLSFGVMLETDLQFQYPLLNAKGEVLRILILDKSTGEVNVSLPDGNEVQSLSYATEMLESSSKKKLSTYPV